MQKNDFIRIKYTAKMKENNIEFDKNEDMPLVAGAEWVMKNLDKEILKMNVSEKKTIEIAAEDAIGKRNDKFIETRKLAEIKKMGIKNPVVGMPVQVQGNDGRIIVGKIISVSSGRVKVDFNHPLAGKTLIFDIEILKKIEDDEDKIKAIIEWFMKPKTEADKKLFDDIVIKIDGSEVELNLPPLVTLNSVYKRKISDDIINFLGMEKIKFLEVFEKQKPIDIKKVEELNAQLPVEEVN